MYDLRNCDRQKSWFSNRSNPSQSPTHSREILHLYLGGGGWAPREGQELCRIALKINMHLLKNFSANPQSRLHSDCWTRRNNTSGKPLALTGAVFSLHGGGFCCCCCCLFLQLSLAPVLEERVGPLLWDKKAFSTQVLQRREGRTSHVGLRLGSSNPG